MIEIYPNLYVGNQEAYEQEVAGQPGWKVVQACKEPYHRQALGYKGSAADKNHPEYYLAYRDNRLILNLVDADDPKYFHAAVIDAALEFIHAGLTEGHKVLVHCNQGESRSPSIALLYLVYCGAITAATVPEAELQFKQRYPTYNPKTGIRGYLLQNWDRYCPPIP